jgi:hypothetical protein
MKRIVLSLGVTLAIAGAAMAQTTATSSSSAKAAQTASASRSGLAAGTQVSGQLQNSLDVRRAKVGDEVLLKTTQSVKQDGRIAIAKGSTLIGHVTAVQKQAKSNANSSVSILFDSLQQGSSRMPISAAITSIVSTRTAASLAGEDMQSDTYGSSNSRSSTRSSAGNGGLLGGVSNTVGGVVNTTTQTVGGVANTTGQTVGSTSRIVGSSVKGLTISQSANASAQGGSTLTMSRGDLHLDEGTTFNLVTDRSPSSPRPVSGSTSKQVDEK